MKLVTISILATLSTFSYAHSVKMLNVQSGKPAGTVEISETEHGLVFQPSLKGIAPGGHGFHLHENPTCESAVKKGKKVPAGAAGSHYDPQNTDKHGYPWGEDNHLGDLPLLYVDEKGNADTPVLAPRLSMGDIEGRALMVHEEGDNYSDAPQKLGGGGARVLCGVIKASK
ncbi:superoxide dismutase [Cu-Zn] SodC [Alteromonas sp. ASW11-130]|uniref:superoxide dismutase [Cu-Zn] SodC n=1 Tax=Alteromonas sp. ASW11-130 TaxID=3015775 RepID=UPI002241EC81|nr:superoxide dismutase [Cu-Zn] SodC [Alteromonas sp. ASW11-130]MCW8093299.1 superoxide dismutase [Cu-Zn] SodC [Alteromonas sp. ASW11-130]